jgi:endo-beta-N-acetylglucosaminidase D
MHAGVTDFAPQYVFYLKEGVFMEDNRLGLTEEEIADVVYILSNRKEELLNKVLFYNSMIKDNCVKRLDMLTNVITGVNAEILKIDLIIMKLKKIL